MADGEEILLKHNVDFKDWTGRARTSLAHFALAAARVDAV